MNEATYTVKFRTVARNRNERETSVKIASGQTLNRSINSTVVSHADANRIGIGDTFSEGRTWFVAWHTPGNPDGPRGYYDIIPEVN